MSKNDTAVASFDTVNGIIAYESGELDEDGIIELFQHLIYSGLCWRLQGAYGRMAQALIDQGLCHGTGA